MSPLRKAKPHPLPRTSYGLLMILAFLLFLPTMVLGESIELKDGKVLKGNIAAWSSNMTDVYFVPEDPQEKSRWVSLTEIERLDLNAGLSKGKERGVPLE